MLPDLPLQIADCETKYLLMVQMLHPEQITTGVWRALAAGPGHLEAAAWCATLAVMLHFLIHRLFAFRLLYVYLVLLRPGTTHGHGRRGYHQHQEGCDIIDDDGRAKRIRRPIFGQPGCGAGRLPGLLSTLQRSADLQVWSPFSA